MNERKKNSLSFNMRTVVHFLDHTPPTNTASNSLQRLCSTHVFPDVESSSLNIVSRSLLPTMRKLKWSLQCDKLAKVFKMSGASVSICEWLEKGDSQGRKVLQEGEKVRLAVCPNIRSKVGFYERQ